MRIRDVAAKAQELMTSPKRIAGVAVEMFDNPEQERDFYSTIIKLCQKKEDLFLSEKHDTNKVLGEADRILSRTEEAYALRAKELYPAKPELTALDEAKGIIYGDREETYGRPDKNLNLIAALWENYLNGCRSNKDTSLPYIYVKASDVALMMVLLKVARHANKYNRDNIVDGIGYFALVDRIKEELKGE